MPRTPRALACALRTGALGVGGLEAVPRPEENLRLGFGMGVVPIDVFLVHLGFGAKFPR